VPHATRLEASQATFESISSSMPLTRGGTTRGNNGVRQFWFLLIGLAGALVVVGLTIGNFLAKNRHHASLHINEYLLAGVVIALGVAGQVLVRLVDPQLNGATDASLTATYRQRFFLWVGVGEAPAFLGLLAAVATDRFWLYLVGCVFAVLSYVHIAPTARNLARDQARLDQNGTPRSLVSALGAMPTRTSRHA
jgi:hypothetical protein